LTFYFNLGLVLKKELAADGFATSSWHGSIFEREKNPYRVSVWSFLHTALIRDMLALFGKEIQVWECTPFKDVPKSEVNATLDRIAELMSDPNEK